MKTMFTASALSIATLIASSARAEAPMGTGTWEGSGSAVERSGKKVSDFEVRVTRKEAGVGKVRADGIVKLSNGHEIRFWQEFERKSEGGFALTSDRGKGGGRCFDNGMCQTYEATENGHAFATTLAKDEEGKLRLVITELEHGQAVKFFYQTLRKTQ